MKHGQVTIKDLDEFLRFTLCDYDMRTIDDNYISILLPRQFDINKVFGLDVCDDDYVVLYLCWYPDKDVFGRQFEMRLYHYDNSNDIVMTQSQYDAVLQRFKEQYKKAYGSAGSPAYRFGIDEFDDANIAERAKDILDNLAEIFGSDEQED